MERDRDGLRSRQRLRHHREEVRRHLYAALRRNGRHFKAETDHGSHWAKQHYDWLQRMIESQAGSLKVNLGLQAIRERWLRLGLEVVESKHLKDWMHSIYTFDPNGLMVECAYVCGTLPQHDATHAYQLFVEKKDIDEIGYEREGVKGMTLHLPDPSVAKPECFLYTVKQLLNMDLDQVKDVPFLNVVQH